MELFNELDNSAGSRSVKSTIFTVPFFNNSDSDSDDNDNDIENANDANKLIYDSPQSSQQIMLDDNSAYGKHQMNIFGEGEIVNEFNNRHGIKDNIIQNIRKRLEGKSVNSSESGTRGLKIGHAAADEDNLPDGATQTDAIGADITQTIQVEDNITQTIQVEDNITQTIQVEDNISQTIPAEEVSQTVLVEVATQTVQVDDANLAIDTDKSTTQAIQLQEGSTQTSQPIQFVTQTNQITNTGGFQVNGSSQRESASDADDNDDQVVVTQRLKSRTIIADDDEDDDEDKDKDEDEDEDKDEEDQDQDQESNRPQPGSDQSKDPFNDNNNNEPQNASDISNHIANYKLLSREEKIKARVAELQKLRENTSAKEGNEIQEESETSVVIEDANENELENDMASKVLRKTGKDKKLERLREQAKLIKHSELIKKSSPIIRVINKDKFTTEKFIENFNKDSDSDSESDSPRESIKLFSDEKSKTPLSSPKHENIVKDNMKPLLSIKKFIHNPNNDSKNVINLSSDSSDAENDKEIDKAKTLSIKYKFSRKLRRSNIKSSKTKLDYIINRKLIKEHKDRERLKNNDEVSKILQKTSVDDNEILKLYYQQQEFEKNLRLKEIKEKKLLKRRKRLLLSGKLPTHDDDPEYSEFSSNEEVEEEETDEEKEKDRKSNDAESDNESDNDNSGIKFQLLPSTGIKNMNISLSDLADSTLSSFTQDELTSLEKFKKLRGDDENNKPADIDNNESIVGDTTESFIRTNLNNTNDQLISKMLKSVEFEDEKNESKNNLQLDGDNLRDILDSQNLLMETQVDEETQLVESEKEIEDDNDDNDGDDDDDDDDDDEKIKSSRKIQLDRIDDDNEADREDNSSDSDAESEEFKLARLAQIKLAREDEKRKRHQREKEFRLKGLNTIMEKEAVESDDEYQGIGGLDRDVSDVENSEDEKMIDDGSKISVNEDEIRRNINKEELEQDQKDVQKVFKDIKTGALRKRRAKDGAYDLELSDDDDGMAILEKLRKRQLYEQQHLRNGKNDSTNDDPAKAFFDAISFNKTRSASSFQFEQQMVSLSDDDDDDDDAIEFNGKKASSKENTPDNEKRSSEGPMKKKRRTSEEFRISINSYLEDNNNDLSIQSAINDLSDDDGLEEIKNIKKNTRIKSNSIIKNSSNNFSEDTQTIDESDDVDAFSVLALRSGSVTASFKKSTKKLVKISENTGNIIREVNVTTSSKPAMHSKGAVTKLASSESASLKKEKIIVKGSKLDRLERKLQNTRKRGNLRKLVATKGFR